MPYPNFLRLAVVLLLSISLSWLVFANAEVEDDDEALADLPEMKLTMAKDLQSLGELARSRKVPILIMFSMEGCDYCTVMEQNYLIPMLRSGDYENKAIIREVKIDAYDTLRDFDGGKVSSGEFPDRYRANVTPTLVFLDPQGKELVAKIVGVGTEGFFAGEIDTAIEKALQRL